jgi:Mrp family chromosome partitioning ATPase
MNMVRSMAVKDAKLKLTLASTAIPVQHHSWVKDKATAAVSEFSGVEEVTVNLIEARPKELNQLERIIAVMSGKWGVGKSLVASLLAASFAREGKNVGILYADITSPSIPKMFGLNTRPSGSETGILPSEDEAVIWRGSLRAKAITQFWEEVLWDKRPKFFLRKSKGEEMAKASGAPLLTKLPIEPELAKLCDEVRIE